MARPDLTGHLDLLLLAVLEDAPAHGYRVIETLRDRSDGAFDLPEGTVYPALHRLERAALLTSRWDETTPRRRRIYAVTPSGIRQLEGRRREWSGFSRAVQAVIAT